MRSQSRASRGRARAHRNIRERELLGRRFADDRSSARQHAVDAHRLSLETSRACGERRRGASCCDVSAHRRVAVAIVGWLIATAITLLILMFGGIDRDLPRSGFAALFASSSRRLLVIACMLLASIVTIDFIVSRNARGFRWVRAQAASWRWLIVLRAKLRYPASYRICGLLLLILGSSIPAIGFFDIGTRVEQEMLVKFAQLHVASKLEERMNRLAMLTPDDANAQATLIDDVFRYRLADIFHSRWCI